MKNARAHIRMHYVNSKKSQIIFWSVMLGVLALALIIALILRAKGYMQNTPGAVTNISAPIIFAFISSLVSFNETFGYTLNMGCTRKGYAFNFIIYNILLAGVLSVFLNILLIGEFFIFKGFGFKAYTFGYGSGIFTISNIISNILLHFAMLLVFAALAGLIGSIYHLRGMMFLFGLGVVISSFLFFPTVRDATLRTLIYIGNSLYGEIPPFGLIIYSIVFSSLCYIIMYAKIIKSPVFRE